MQHPSFCLRAHSIGIGETQSFFINVRYLIHKQRSIVLVSFQNEITKDEHQYRFRISIIDKDGPNKLFIFLTIING